MRTCAWLPRQLGIRITCFLLFLLKTYAWHTQVKTVTVSFSLSRPGQAGGAIMGIDSSLVWERNEHTGTVGEQNGIIINSYTSISHDDFGRPPVSIFRPGPYKMPV